MIDFERNSEPVQRRSGIDLDFAAELHFFGELGSAEHRLAGAENIFD